MAHAEMLTRGLSLLLNQDENVCKLMVADDIMSLRRRMHELMTALTICNRAKLLITPQ